MNEINTERMQIFSNSKLRFIKNKYQIGKKHKSESNLTYIKKAEDELLHKKTPNNKFLQITSNFQTKTSLVGKKPKGHYLSTSESLNLPLNNSMLPSLESSVRQNITEATESKNNNYIRSKLIGRSEALLSKEEAQVLNLNKWQENMEAMNKRDDDMDCLANKYSEIEIKYKEKKLQDGLAKFNLQFLSKTLAQFYRKSEEEKASIFIQNINLSKENFRFDVFIDNLMADEDLDDIENKNFIQLGNKVAFRDKREIRQGEDSSEVNDAYFTRFYNLKMGGEMSKLTSIEFYRNIIKERERVEKIYRKE
jgi:hypothetical protein